MDRSNYYLLALGTAIEYGGREIRNLERLLSSTNLNIQLLRLSFFTNQMPYPEKNNAVYYKRIKRYRPLVRGDR